MAFKEVEIDEDLEGGSFFKFSAVGDRLFGIFVSKAMSSAGKYGPKMEYSFRTKEGDVKVTPPTLLARGFENADLQPGDRVIALYTGDLPAQKEGHSPTKRFSLKVESAKDAKAAAAAAPKPAPKPPPPVADEFDDIPA